MRTRPRRRPDLRCAVDKNTIMARAQVAVEEIYQSALKLTLEKEDKDCENLVYMYKYIGDRARKCETFKEFVNCADGQFLQNLEKNIADLETVERQILVIGETSAGKSSFLNLLIGHKVLPESTRPLTSYVCRIKQGTRLSANISYVGKKQRPVKSITGVSYDTMRTTLKQWMTEGDPKSHESMFIDVFVPCSLLEGNLCLVDTPGFGNNDKDTELLLSYLPKAVGIVFILNTTVAFGLGVDSKGNLILDQLKAFGDKVPSFDRSKVLFIANKWDQVTEKEERESHLKATFDRIQRRWKDVQMDHLLPLSVHRVRTVQEQNGCHRKDDKEFLDSYSEIYRKLTDIVKHCAVSRSPAHKPRLANLYTKFKSRMQDVFTFYYLSETDQKKMIAQITTWITELESTSEQGEREIGRLSNEVESILATDIHQYIHDSGNRREIFSWTQHNMPDADDLANVKSEAEILIGNFLNAAISKRMDQKSHLKERVQHKMDEITSKIKTLEKDIESSLEKADREAWSRRKGNNVTVEVKSDRILIPTSSGLQIEFDEDDRTAMAVIGVTAPVWVPIVIAGSLTVLPVYLLAKFANRAYKHRQYMQDKQRYLQKWADKIIQEQITMPYLLNHIHLDAKNGIKKEKKRIVCCIKVYEKVLQELSKNMKSKKKPSGFTEMATFCCQMEERRLEPLV